MIQKGTYLNVLDNSGAKTVCCIHVFGGYRKRYAKLGDTIVVSVKSLRPSEDDYKVKKGDVVKAIVVRTKITKNTYSTELSTFFDNSVVLINNQNKFFCSKVFGSLPRQFRYTKCLRLLSLSPGIVN